MFATGIFVVLIIALVWMTRAQKSQLVDDEEHCPHCGYDVRASESRCPECGMPFRRPEERIPLRDDWPADAITPRVPRPDETPVLIHSTKVPWEANALREQLEARGVRAQVHSPQKQPMNPYTNPAGAPIGDWQVVVWSGDVELAISIRDRLIPVLPPPVSG